MAALIFHITERACWERSLADGRHTSSTRGADLADEGFIHCSSAEQWPRVRTTFYADAGDLVLLHIDPDRLEAPLVIEQLEGAPEPFPHVYGPLNLDAVVHVQPL